MLQPDREVSRIEKADESREQLCGISDHQGHSNCVILGSKFRVMTMAIVRVMVMAMTMAMLMTTVTAMAMVTRSSITDSASDSQQLVLGQASLPLSQVEVLGQRVVLAHLAKSQVMSC